MTYVTNELKQMDQEQLKNYIAEGEYRINADPQRSHVILRVLVETAKDLLILE